MNSTSARDLWTDFIETYEEFKEISRKAVQISETRIGVDHTGRQNRVLAVFMKLVIHCGAVEILVGPVATSRDGLLDHFTLGMMARSIIDASIMTMYLSEPSLSLSQWRLRRRLLYLQEMIARSRLIKAGDKSSALAGGKNARKSSSGSSSLAEARTELANLAKEHSYDNKKIERFLSGIEIFVDGARGAVREAGWDVARYDFYQVYYSSYVHSHPVSFMRIDQHQISWSTPSDFQLNFVTGVLVAARDYIADVVVRMNAFTGHYDLDPLGQVDW